MSVFRSWNSKLKYLRLVWHKQFGVSSEKSEDTLAEQLSFLFNEAEVSLPHKRKKIMQPLWQPVEICYGKPFVQAGTGDKSLEHPSKPSDHVQLDSESNRGLFDSRI